MSGRHRRSKRLRCPCDICAPLWVAQDAEMPLAWKVMVYVIMTAIPVVAFIIAVVMQLLAG